MVIRKRGEGLGAGSGTERVPQQPRAGAGTTSGGQQAETAQPQHTARNTRGPGIGQRLVAVLRRYVPLPECMHHQFTLTGLNLERFLNTMQKEEIALVRARRVDQRTLRCICRTADLERIAAVAQDKGWRLENAAPVGVSAKIRRALQRPGLLVGAAVAMALLVAAMQFVWLIRIDGAGAYQADIAAYLAEEGYRTGMRKNQTDAATLALLLQRRYPEVAWFRVYVTNVTLVVECTQGVPAPPLPSGEPGDLLASRDGVVQSVQVYGGTALVRPGDLVRKGQVLIRGEEQGADGEMVPVAARGKVLGRCWQEVTVRVPLQETLSRETGRSQRVVQLCTPWLRWPQTAETPDYLTYHLYLTETPVVGSFFPVWQRVTEYREVELEYGMRPANEALEEAEAAARKQLHRALRGYVMEDEWMETRLGEDGYAYATASGEWMMDLCRTEEELPDGE